MNGNNKVYPFLRKQPSMDEVSFQNRMGRLRQTALSQDSGLAVIPKNLKYGKINKNKSKKLTHEL